MRLCYRFAAIIGRLLLSASCKVPGGISILDLGRKIIAMDQSPLGTTQ